MNRNEIQEAAKNAWVRGNRKSLLMLAPRVGKCRVGINIIQAIKAEKVLITAPLNEIKTSWENEYKILGIEPNFEFVTFTSIEKYKDWKGDLLIIDEPQDLSANEMAKLEQIVDRNQVLLLTGTLTKKTEKELGRKLGIDVCYEYTIAEAVKDGILADYEIVKHIIPLDDKVAYIASKKGNITEKAKYNQLIWLKSKLAKDGKNTFFLDIKIISLLQNSIAKTKKTKELLQQFDNQRVIVFCGSIDVADNLEIPVYHSKAREKELFEDFCSGKGDKLATIKLASTGITIKPINYSIVNYTSGNPEDTAQKICRVLGIEYNNPDKKAIIHLICSDTEFEKIRLGTALQFFCQTKIKTLT